MKKAILVTVLTSALCMVAGVAKADFTFGEPAEVPNVNSSSKELNASISADGLSLYFVSDRPGGVGGRDIWVATRETTDDVWGEPVNLGPTINTPAGEWGVSISYDGLSLYFDTLQADGAFANDLWVATRATTDDDWGNPVSLGPTVNSSSGDDYTPSISSDNLSLYFMSNRSGGVGAYDLWVTTRETTDEDWGAPVNLGPPVNSSGFDVYPGISADGLLLFFASFASAADTRTDLWVTSRATTDDPWGQPVDLGPTVNSSAWDDYPNVSADGSTLFFRRSLSGLNSGGDIWQAPIIPIVDFNSDGFVDDGDLDILNSYLDTNETLCDIGPMPWGDGIVDEADLDVLMSYWGQEITVPPELIKWRYIVDDFEQYTDDPPNEIFTTWIDGSGDPTNGATVGYPFPEPGEHHVETTIVHNGAQSMPFFYDNTEASISEATRAWEVPQDWTREGVSELGLWFRGYPEAGNFTEGPAGTYTMAGSGTDIWNNSDAFHFAYKQLTGAGSIIAKVESVDQTDDWAKVGVMIRETLDADSKHAMMIVTPAKGVSFQRRTSTGGASSGTTRAGIRAPRWVKIERTASGRFIASYSGNGSSWTQLGTVNISMGETVYIGLAVTSHTSSAMCEAVFSNVSIEGDVIQEAWTSQDIGITSNVAEPMYVALNGNAVVYHDDPNAALIDDWTLWRIDLQEFADQGVDLTSVNLMTIGFGNKENTTTGGEGLVFFDYIGLR